MLLIRMIISCPKDVSDEPEEKMACNQAKKTVKLC